MHVVEAFGDVCQCPVVSHVLVNLDFSLQVICHSQAHVCSQISHTQSGEYKPQLTFNQARKLSTSLYATESGAAPSTPSHKLEAIPSTKFLLGSYLRYRTINTHGRVDISWPAAATPMTVLTPQPLWHASSAERIT